MTPIVPIRKQETKNFGNEPIHEFWLEISASASSVNNNNDYMNRLKNCLESAPKDGVICVFSEELSCKTLCESIAKARDNNNRIYILTNNYHDEMKILEGCLIRYGGGKRIGSFIIIKPNNNMSSGCLFTGGFSDNSVNLSANLLLDLNTEQVSVFFRYFCYQFWNKAEKERIGREEHNTKSAPLDIYPPVGDSCDLEYLKSVWGKKTKNVQITTGLLKESPYIKFSSFTNSAVVTLFSGIDDNLVRSLKQKQNEIYAHEDVDLINSIKTPDGTWLMPMMDIALEKEVYALLLTADQSKILDSHINTVLRGKVKYQYYESNTRENVSGKTIFHIGNSPSQKYMINAESHITAKSVQPPEFLPKDEFENLKPELNDDGKSVSIKYEWINTPFTLPSGSKKHQLYQKWESEENSIDAYIDQIMENILENEKKGNTLSKLVAGLFGIKKQQFSVYRNDLDKLYKFKHGAVNRQKLEDNIKKINEIRSAVEKDSGEIIEEDRKARLQEQNDAKKIDPGFIGILEQLVKDQGNAALMNEKCKALLKDYTKNEYKRERQLLLQAVEEDVPKVIEGAEDLVACKKAQIRKLEEENGLDSVVAANIVNALALVLRGDTTITVSSKVSVPAIPPPVSQKGGGKKPGQSGQTRELSVPQLPQLPSVGYLFNYNGQDYLAITNWEDYDQGKAEAKRLNAKLCAKG